MMTMVRSSKLALPDRCVEVMLILSTDLDAVAVLARLPSGRHLLVCEIELRGVFIPASGGDA